MTRKRIKLPIDGDLQFNLKVFGHRIAEMKCKWKFSVDNDIPEDSNEAPQKAIEKE